MDNDLISRSALLEEICNTCTHRGYDCAPKHCPLVTVLIKHIAAVDAVPVVRCRECKHTETDGCEDPAIYCKKWDRWEMPPDFYCGYGERRTE